MSDQPAPYVVLAAINTAEGSPFVVSTALELASAHPNAALHVLAVNEPGPAFALPDFVPSAEQWVKPDLDGLTRFVKSQVDDFRQRRPTAPVARVEAHCALGAPADEIVWLAANLDADLVVVGTHGRRGLKRLILGSVAEKVARLCGCPVVVVREKHHVAPWKAPEIEPICPDCAEARKASGGAELWCARHKEHHLRAHVYSTAGRSHGPSASESSTGT